LVAPLLTKLLLIGRLCYNSSPFRPTNFRHIESHGASGFMQLHDQTEPSFQGLLTLLYSQIQRTYDHVMCTHLTCGWFDVAK